ncbi:hypothetical protein [Candidatus Harpocratesius sp.]
MEEIVNFEKLDNQISDIFNPIQFGMNTGAHLIILRVKNMIGCSKSIHEIEKALDKIDEKIIKNYDF